MSVFKITDKAFFLILLIIVRLLHVLKIIK